MIDKIDKYIEIIKINIEYEILCERYDKKRIDDTIQIMLEPICSLSKIYDIGKEKYPTILVKERMFMIKSDNIEYVYDCMDKNATKIHNIKNYTLKSLFNAPITMDSYYEAEVNNALYGINDK